MVQIPYVAVDRERIRDATPLSQLTGADRRIAKDPEVLAWLGRVYAEKHHKSRDWPVFDSRQLGRFLFAAGVDSAKAVELHEEAVPVPPELCDIETCLDKLKGASFLAQPIGRACLLLRERGRGAPFRASRTSG